MVPPAVAPIMSPSALSVPVVDKSPPVIDRVPSVRVPPVIELVVVKSFAPRSAFLIAPVNLIQYHRVLDEFAYVAPVYDLG